MAYNVATEDKAFVNKPNGSGTISITYTGNAGEPPITIEYNQSLSTTPTADYIRGIAINQLNILNTTASFIAAQVIPTVLDTTTPVSPVSPPLVSGSYIAASDPFTPPATPTDVATIYGSATKNIIVSRISLITTQTTAGLNTWKLIKRSTLNTGGTSTSLVKIPINSRFPAATAVVLQYSANPATLGTSVGNVWSGKVTAPSLTSLVGGYLEVPILQGGPITLNNVNQGLAVNFGGIALPVGLSVQVIFNWTE